MMGDFSENESTKCEAGKDLREPCLFSMLMHLEFGLRTRVVGCHWAKEYTFAFRTVILRTVGNASALAWNSMEDRGREPVWRSGNASRDKGEGIIHSVKRLWV